MTVGSVALPSQVRKIESVRSSLWQKQSTLLVNILTSKLNLISCTYRLFCTCPLQARQSENAMKIKQMHLSVMAETFCKHTKRLMSYIDA